MPKVSTKFKTFEIPSESGSDSESGSASGSGYESHSDAEMGSASDSGSDEQSFSDSESEPEESALSSSEDEAPASPPREKKTKKKKKAAPAKKQKATKPRARASANKNKKTTKEAAPPKKEKTTPSKSRGKTRTPAAKTKPGKRARSVSPKKTKKPTRAPKRQKKEKPAKRDEESLEHLKSVFELDVGKTTKLSDFPIRVDPLVSAGFVQGRTAASSVVLTLAGLVHRRSLSHAERIKTQTINRDAFRAFIHSRVNQAFQRDPDRDLRRVLCEAVDAWHSSHKQNPLELAYVQRVSDDFVDAMEERGLIEAHPRLFPIVSYRSGSKEGHKHLKKIAKELGAFVVFCLNKCKGAEDVEAFEGQRVSEAHTEFKKLDPEKVEELNTQFRTNYSDEDSDRLLSMLEKLRLGIGTRSFVESSTSNDGAPVVVSEDVEALAESTGSSFALPTKQGTPINNPNPVAQFMDTVCRVFTDSSREACRASPMTMPDVMETLKTGTGLRHPLYTSKEAEEGLFVKQDIRKRVLNKRATRIAKADGKKKKKKNIDDASDKEDGNNSESGSSAGVEKSTEGPPDAVTTPPSPSPVKHESYANGYNFSEEEKKGIRDRIDSLPSFLDGSSRKDMASSKLSKLKSETSGSWM